MPKIIWYRLTHNYKEGEKTLLTGIFHIFPPPISFDI